MNRIKPSCLISASSASWSPLYRLTVVLAVIMLLLILTQIAVFIISPPPETIEGFFSLFRSNWFAGLLSLDLIYILDNLIIIFIYLALFVRLFEEKPFLCLAALVLGLVGIASYFSSNPTFEMLTLSAKYFNAPPQDQGIYLAAGEALLAGYTGTSFNVYYIANGITLILFSSAIIKSPGFGKQAGIWGLASGILMSVPSSAGMIGMIFSLLSLIPWMVFLVLLAKRFQSFYKSSCERE